jgi:hypothetical protein
MPFWLVYMEKCGMVFLTPSLVIYVSKYHHYHHHHHNTDLTDTASLVVISKPLNVPLRTGGSLNQYSMDQESA